MELKYHQKLTQRITFESEALDKESNNIEIQRKTELIGFLVKLQIILSRELL